MKRAIKTVSFVLVIGLIVAAGWVRLPYYALGPGPAREVEPLIVVQGHPTYPSAGKMFLTTVSFYQVTPFQALQAWVDPNLALVRSDLLYPPGTTHVQEQRQGISQMDQSKIDATYVVLSRLTSYPKDHGSGALLEQVLPGCPADGRLYAGDTVMSIDGKPIGSKSDVLHVLQSVPAAAPLRFHISAAGQQQDVTVIRRPCDGSSTPLVGIVPIDQFPFSISISSGDIGGPSAGLMWSLALYDLLTPGDLTKGRTISGTGTLDLAGKVGPIGGIRDKVIAAEGVGASLFFAPAGNMNELKGVDPKGMKVVSVASFEDALRYLQNN